MSDDGFISRIKRDLEDTRLIVIDTVQALLERGERLSDLNVRTEVLLEQSERLEARISNSQTRTQRTIGFVARGIAWTARTVRVSILLVLTRIWEILSILFPIHQGITAERYERAYDVAYTYDSQGFFDEDDEDEDTISERKKTDSYGRIGEYDTGAELIQRRFHAPHS